MDEAISVETHETVYAMVLQKKINSGEIQLMSCRGTDKWLCPGCRQPVVFRKSVKGASGACFVVRENHPLTCDMGGRDVESAEGRVEKVLPSPTPDVKAIHLTLGAPKEKKEKTERRVAEGESSGAGEDVGKGASGEDQGTREVERSADLGKLLRSLVRNPDYPQVLEENGIPITGTDRGEARATDLIWKMGDFEPNARHVVGKHIIVWGVIGNIQSGRGASMYINQGTRDANYCAVCIKTEDINRVLQENIKSGFEAFGEMQGWYFIAYGVAKGKSTGGMVMYPVVGNMAVVHN